MIDVPSWDHPGIPASSPATCSCVRSSITTAYHSLVTTTPLIAVHERLGATMTEFAGWIMPLRYGSETAEHNAVRTAAGLFDLSHMGEIAVTGPGAGAALDYALVGNLSALRPGRARYTMICAPDGGVLDDLVVYRQGPERFLVVANAANTATVLSELRARCAPSVVTDETEQTALIAIQGQNAVRLLPRFTELRYYAGTYGEVAGHEAWVARTGYTGEDGFEVYCSPSAAVDVWEALSEARPAGLAARDTLRLEAGMPLYGNELSREVTPYEAGLGRVVKLDKPGDFVGRDALALRAASGPRRVLAGLAMRSRRVPRHGYAVVTEDGEPCGVVTSGAPSPTLGHPIAMAYLEPGAPAPFGIDIRGRTERADVVELPFYDRSKHA
jgi:aminomethyltransferase